MKSGKFVLRIPTDQHLQLSKEAKRKGVSLNTLCLEKIQRSVRAEWDLWIPFIREAFDSDLAAIVLFGSRARGDFASTSDVDLLVVLKKRAKVSRALYQKWDKSVSSHLPVNLNPSFVEFDPDRSDSGLWLELALDGNLIWQKDNSVQLHLVKLRNMIAEGKYRRRYVHGQPQWITQNSEPKE